MNSTEVKDVMKIGKFSLTPGAERQNQDAFGCSSDRLTSGQKVHLVVIADGMGGHSLGNAASYFAVDYVLKWWHSTIWMNDDPTQFLSVCKEKLINLFHEINDRLIEIGKLEKKEIGTTLSVILFVEDQYFICHIGDSRIYRYRANITELEEPNGDTIDLNKEKTFLQLTVDHSYASMQVENGLMTTEEAHAHDKAHYLTQCMGIKGEVEPYTASGMFTAVDYFLLCTDGFHTLFTDKELSREWTAQLEQQQSMENVTAHFYDLTKAKKHSDDATILTVHFPRNMDPDKE
ncbi:PP2C family protein-serine/threonine phosphatase [Gracilibacillus alcaliphilus]|uniref:PP2C family protein-serine/threonine phosphatase n=1 Tax=Gracilibacillus alcaliphilus TaxID=1401441 RepID=UPI001957C976|nr:PP2C family serine/threonine-protein phosphatase [Gracilibacillus alcaliphilus]MBM7676560.1 protein phosphatase [Gracilibacillus alcaliphilus]